MNGNCGSQNNVYIGARYVPKIVGEWSADVAYEPLTVVLYQGTSYTSITYVPKGIIPGDNTQQYWALTGNYNAQVEMYRQDVEKVKLELNELKQNITYSFETAQDMKLFTQFEDGNIILTNGYLAPNDNGEAIYVVQPLNPNIERPYIQLNSNLMAVMQNTPIANIASVGAIRGSDISTLLPKLFKVSKTINLNGLVTKCNNVSLPNDITIINGTLENDGQNIFNASDVTNVTLKNIIFDGISQGEQGVNLNSCNNIEICGCIFRNFTTQNSVTCGIFSKRCTNLNINGNTFNNIIGVGDGILGNAKGASRSYASENDNNLIFQNNVITNILGKEDGDGLHFNGDESYNILVQNNYFGYSDRRLIKIQAPHVKVINNYFITTQQHEYLVTIYNNDFTFKDNYANIISQNTISIGGGGKTKCDNILIENNDITQNKLSYQGMVVFSEVGKLASNINIINNKYENLNATVGDVLVMIRTYFKNVQIKGNISSSVVNGVWLRNIDDVTPIVSEEFKDNLIIKDNIITASNNLIYADNKSVSQNIIIENNIFTATNPLSYALNIARFETNQWNNSPIIRNNRITNSNIVDGWAKTGGTNQRPTNNPPLLWTYYDNGIERLLWWNGSNWLDPFAPAVSS